MYRPVPPHIDLTKLEHDVLRRWREEDTFGETLRQRAGAPLWSFYEGPPTANGHPGTHHIEARVFKDVFPRYRTMKGHLVPRKAGWDCHGLPVEIAVEKELGFTGKQDIENYGVSKFNERCRESVLRHVGEFEEMTERLGYWVDTSDAYWTMNPEYIDSLWWGLKQIYERGLLVEDHRVAPYCPRCGTGLSDHELSQGYETVVDPSVYVRFPITDAMPSEFAALTDPAVPAPALLVWTTTPWTLVSNTGVAVHPDVQYQLVKTSTGELLVLAEPLVSTVLGDDVERLASVSGNQLVGVRYQRPFELVDVDPTSQAVHTVMPAEFVTVSDGTGLVHLAPAFGPDDLLIGREFGLPVVNPLTPEGHFGAEVPLVGGQFFKKADEALVTDLETRGLLFRHVPYEHAYPHCWRCHTPLMYYAQPSWYIRTTAIKDRLIAENQQTNWFPDSIKNGRYGDWLNNNIDWALSRNRYWGTPLPIWRCDNRHLTVVGSRAELAERSGQDLHDLDPHRPFVDEVELTCDECAQPARRVPEVADVWFDSGCMPFAQWGYPHLDGSVQTFNDHYPAEYICEAIDQTRGWFYTLMTVGTLVFDNSSYRNVLCLGHLLDKDGRKMSKHLGNTLDPMALMERHGADAVRWFMLASGSPWAARRVSHEAIQEIVRKTLLTYWNTVSFHVLYAGLAGWSPGGADVPSLDQRPILDRWLASRAAGLVADVDDALESFDSQTAGKVIASFIDDMSNWYVRRSRRRFWDGDPAAFATLHDAIEKLTLVLAPIAPFITERVWSDVVAATSDDAPPSVHLADWPTYDAAVIDADLERNVALTRRLVELGRAARAESGVRTRQPLGRALVAASGWDQVPAQLHAQLAEELNVQSIDSLGDVGEDLVQVSAKANFRALGKHHGKLTPSVAAAISNADPAQLMAAIREQGRATVSLPTDDGTLDVDVLPNEVVLTETPRAGWAVQHAGGESIALDLTLTPELRELGAIREVVRLIQDARKSGGLDVADRVTLRWHASDRSDGSVDLASAFQRHQALVAAEVLATEVIHDSSLNEEHRVADNDLGLLATVRPIT